MPNIYLRITNISKRKGKCCVAACAYRTGLKLNHYILGETYDYTKKSGIEQYGIELPTHAPVEYLNPEILWNAVEKVELKTKDANTAKEITLALDNTLAGEKAEKVVSDFSKYLATKGMCVTWAIHDVIHDGKRNLHAHLMTTVRPIKEDGTWGSKEQKTYKLDSDSNRIPVIDPTTGEQKIGPKGRKLWERELKSTFLPNTKEFARTIKPIFTDIQNTYLPTDRKRTSKSYSEQGITEYDPEIHVGVSATAIHRKHKKNPDMYSEESERYLINQAIKAVKAFFQKLLHLKALEKLEKQVLKIKEQKRKDKEIEELKIQNALSKLKNELKKIHDKKTESEKELKTIDAKTSGRGSR